MKRSLLKTMISVSLVTAPGFGVLLAAEVTEAAPSESDKGVINGVVKNSSNDQPIENAILVLQCTCLPGQQERMTNARGIYSFQNLPSGNYTIQALAGKANVSKTTQLARGAKFRANFALNPEHGPTNGDEVSHP